MLCCAINAIKTAIRLQFGFNKFLDSTNFPATLLPIERKAASEK